MKKLLLFVAVLMCAAQAFSQTPTIQLNGTGTTYSTLTAAITAAGATDIITLTAGTLTEKVSIGSNVSKSLTIQGAGIDQTIVQANATPTAAANGEVFKLDGTYTGSITLTIKNMTIQNGNNTTIAASGGIQMNNTGLPANKPTLDLQNLKIYNNTGAAGGGLGVQGNVILKVTACNINGNTSNNITNITNGGGGINLNPGGTVSQSNTITATIKNSTIANNSVGLTSFINNGGGIFLITGSYSPNTTLWIENTTIYGNNTKVTGSRGGGVYIKSGSTGSALTINHCTIANNTTTGGTGGDGVCIETSGTTATTLVMNNSIVMGNSGSTSNASQVGVNTVVSGQSSKITNGGISNSIFGIISGGTWTTNASSHNNNLTAAVGDLGFAASLSSDATPVLVIGSGGSSSVAKDYVGTDYLATPLTADQIGNSRSGNADAGAYEYNASLAIAASATSGGTVSSGTGNFASGASTTLVATPSGNNVFANWTEGGVVVSNSASYTFTVTKARTLVANFTVQYNVQTANDGNGTVSGGGVVAGPITLTATPNAGYAFNAWSVTAGTAPTPPSTSSWNFTPSADCTISASFKSITALTPTVTYARTATTIDVLVTNPVGYTGTLTYNVLDGSDNVLASGVAAASGQTATLVYSATGLSANSSYTYKVVAVINGTINSAPATLTALTRRLANGSIQVIDDFVNNSMGWINSGVATITIPSTNSVTNGINSSATCAQVALATGASSAVGLKNSIERIDVGPNAPYQYLHVKMYRDADNGNIGLTFLVRPDNSSQAQFPSAESFTVTPSASGPWADYVFNLKHSNYASDKTVFGFYIKPNMVTATTASNSYIDDIYLSNDATPSTANLTIPITLTAGTGGTVSANSSYFSGDNATVVATASAGYAFVNWTENGTAVSTNASYSFTVTASRALVANFVNIAYRSKTSGNWSDAGTWETSTDNSNWSAAIQSPTSSAASVSISNTHTVVIAANATSPSLTVNSAANLTLNSGTTLNVTGNFTINSDASGTGSFVDYGGTLTSTTINVQRSLKGGRNWYISSPVSGATASVFNVASSKDLVYSYSESTGTNNPWPQITNSSTALNVMQGYVVNMNADTTINFVGALNTGDQSVTINRTTGQTKEGFNLLGNPYLSHVDIQDADTVHLETSYWLRSRNAGNTAYTFDTYNLKSGIGITNSGLKLTKFIPPMQAFWVRVKQGFSSGSLSFHNALRAHQDSVNNIFRAPASTSLTQQTLRLQVSTGVNTDETVLYTNSNASNGYDDYDSQKMNNGCISVPEIYTLADSEQLSINGLNSIPYDTEIKLGFTTGQAGNFSIKASQLSNFDAGTQLILKDYLDSNNPVVNDLSDGSSYSFTSDVTSNNSSRFALIFHAPSITTGINPNSSTNVWFSTRNGQLMINGTPGNDASIEVFNALGQKVITKNITGTNLQLNNCLPAGAYLLKLTNEGKSITKKIIID